MARFDNLLLGLVVVVVVISGVVAEPQKRALDSPESLPSRPNGARDTKMNGTSRSLSGRNGGGLRQDPYLTLWLIAGSSAVGGSGSVVAAAAAGAATAGALSAPS
jgi:hypothetical protein